MIPGWGGRGVIPGRGRSDSRKGEELSQGGVAVIQVGRSDPGEGVE